MQNILVCFDGSKHALKALHIASDLAEKYGAFLYVLEVLPSKQGGSEKLPSDHLGMARDKLKHRGIVNFKLETERGATLPAILLAVKRHKINTLLMGCRGKSSASAPQFGSVSEDVFREADCTCIAVK